MDQTLNRIVESLAYLLEQKDAGGDGGGGSRLGPTCNVLPSQDSLPSYDQLSSPSLYASSNTASTVVCPNPPPSTTGSQDES